MKKHVITLLFFLSINWIYGQGIFNEKESILIVEIESQQINSAWNKGTSELNGKMLTYYTPKVNNLSTPGVGTLNYQIKINNPGIYRFQWHSKVGEGTKATDSNDNWLKIPDAADFYGQKYNDNPMGTSIGHIVHPKPNCSGEGCPEGSSKDGWMKIYSTGSNNTEQPWKWRTFTSDRDPHRIFAKFDSVGVYTVQVSARSKAHFLDRFVLYKESVYTESMATNLNLEQSDIVEENPSGTNQLKLAGVKIYPNPVESSLMIESTESTMYNYSLFGLNGKKLLSKNSSTAISEINLSTLPGGLYFVRLDFGNGAVKTLKFSKK